MMDELAQNAARLSAARSRGADQLAAFFKSLHGYAREKPGIAIVLSGRRFGRLFPLGKSFFSAQQPDRK